ncbi:uncharacterized protein LOC144169054 [Haemaphysalis longicornis]
MKLLSSVAIIGVYTFLFNPSAASAGPRSSLPRDTPDVFKLFDHFDYVVAIFDQDEDGDLDCVTNVRTQLDMDVPSATYVWMLKGLNGKERRNATLHMFAGQAQDESQFTWDDESTVNVAHFIYTDYKDCVVVDIPFNNIQQCMLWVTNEVKHNIPQHCVEHYDDICPDPIWKFDRESCGDEY